MRSGFCVGILTSGLILFTFLGFSHRLTEKREGRSITRGKSFSRCGGLRTNCPRDNVQHCTAKTHPSRLHFIYQAKEAPCNAFYRSAISLSLIYGLSRHVQTLIGLAEGSDTNDHKNHRQVVWPLFARLELTPQNLGRVITLSSYISFISFSLRKHIRFHHDKSF